MRPAMGISCMAGYGNDVSYDDIAICDECIGMGLRWMVTI